MWWATQASEFYDGFLRLFFEIRALQSDESENIKKGSKCLRSCIMRVYEEEDNGPGDQYEDDGWSDTDWHHLKEYWEVECVEDMEFVTEKLNSYYMEYESGNGYDLPFDIYIELQDLLRECRNWLQYIAPVPIVTVGEVRTVTAEEYAGRRPVDTKVENVGVGGEREHGSETQSDANGGGLQHDIEELQRTIAKDHETIKTLTDDISVLKHVGVLGVCVCVC